MMGFCVCVIVHHKVFNVWPKTILPMCPEMPKGWTPLLEEAMSKQVQI